MGKGWKSDEAAAAAAALLPLSLELPKAPISSDEDEELLYSAASSPKS